MPEPLRLPLTLAAWDTPELPETFKREVAELGAERLPLQQAVACGDHALPLPISVCLLGVQAHDEARVVRAGIFFQSVLSGCSCADDPTPANEFDEYCVLQFVINPVTGLTQVSLAEG